MKREKLLTVPGAMTHYVNLLQLGRAVEDGIGIVVH
jgi:hypothetical protein